MATHIAWAAISISYNTGFLRTFDLEMWAYSSTLLYVVTKRGTEDSPALYGTGSQECYMENLRKVAFTLEQQKMNLFDYETEEERERALRKRNGYFHCFGNAPFYDPEGECLRDRMVGIVEEEGTGNVYHVVPEFKTFVL